MSYRKFGILFFISALATLTAFLVNYSEKGYSLTLLAIWGIAILLAGLYFFFFTERKKIDWISILKKDLWVILGLIIIFAPLYLLWLHDIPWQLNTDEVAVMSTAKRYSDQMRPDIFGLSDYFNYPSLTFVSLGGLANFFGGVTLQNMRLAHALMGLLIIIFGYALFRTALPRALAAGAAILLGSSHALLAVSRMALRDNTSLLLELIALLFLVYSLKNKSLFHSYLGGLFLGLTFYTYYPSRITIVVWLIFTGVSYLVFRKKIGFVFTAKYFLTACVGFIFVASPILTATAKQADSTLSYPKQQFLIFPEGLKLQKEWIGAKSDEEAIMHNIKNGLSTFNNTVTDHGNLYINPGHGFVDPLTGVLIWFGLIFLLFKRGKKEIDLLAITGFIFLWLLFTFVVNKAPQYQRLLIILPFVVYLSIIAITKLSALSAVALKKFTGYSHKFIRLAIFSALIAVIAIWNLYIYSDYAVAGLLQGNDVGGTARFVESKKNIPGLAFYLVADKEETYYWWGEPYWWQDWFGFFRGPDQKAEVLSPKDFMNAPKSPPLIMFMSREVWRKNESLVRGAYSNLNVHNLTPNGIHLGIEVN